MPGTLHERVGHIAVSYKHYIIVWGGLKRAKVHLELHYPTDEIWFYNCLTEVWRLSKTHGYLPYRNSGATAVVSGDYLYIYGGVEEISEELARYGNELHRLNLKTLEWTKLIPLGNPPIGCDKGTGWVFRGKIYFFGGYGEKSYQAVNNYIFDTDSSNLHGVRGWHNQLTVYDPVENTWTSPQTHGQAPSPRATHTSDINGNKIYIFGGRTAHRRVKELYSMDLLTMTWSKVELKPELKDIPEGRSWHTFNFIKKHLAIVYGGLNKEGFPCTDWWGCHVEGSEATWILKGNMNRALVWPKAAFYPDTNELFIVGGVTCSPYNMLPENHVKELLVIQFSPVSLVRLCLQQVLVQGQWQNSEIPQCLKDILRARSDPDMCLSDM